MTVVLQYIALFLVVLFVLPVHEFAHAFAAVKSGDPTPRLSGRYTLNPLKHFDIIGLIMLVVARFGWAKPVPINPYNFRHLKKNYFWVSVAGVIANICMAFIFSFLFVLYSHFIGNLGVKTKIGYYALLFVGYVLQFGVIIDLNLFAFNLIPIYPLDGFRVLEVAVKRKGKVFMFLRTKGGYVLLGLVLWGIVCDRIGGFMGYLDILGNTIGYISNGLYELFTGFWGLIIR